MPAGAVGQPQNFRLISGDIREAKQMQPSTVLREELRSYSPPPTGPVGRSSCLHSQHLDLNGLCGLCFFRMQFTYELPTRLHAYKVLADNGNPETDAKFLAHLQITFGIRPPAKDQPLYLFREERKKLTSPAPGLYPVASIIWEMMGQQPPLAHPFYLAVAGMPEGTIAERLELSRYNLSVRLAKATRYAMRLYNGRYNRPQAEEPAAEADLQGQAS